MRIKQYKAIKQMISKVLDWPRQYVYVDNVLLDGATVPSGIVKAHARYRVIYCQRLRPTGYNREP